MAREYIMARTGISFDEAQAIPGNDPGITHLTQWPDHQKEYFVRHCAAEDRYGRFIR